MERSSRVNQLQEPLEGLIEKIHARALNFGWSRCFDQRDFIDQLGECWSHVPGPFSIGRTVGRVSVGDIALYHGAIATTPR